MLNQTAPHFLLLTQTQSNPDPASHGGVWRFVLEQLGSSKRVEVAEDEPGIWGERLQLLAVVRGLEALEQPSRVTLITPSRFVGNGIRRGLAMWRENGWQWEHFGEMAPIKHCDLWKRIDQALQFHQINCRIWDFDQPNVRHARPSLRNRISFGEIQNARETSFTDAGQVAEEAMESVDPAPKLGLPRRGTLREDLMALRVKPIGQGRAFGLCPS